MSAASLVEHELVQVDHRLIEALLKREQQLGQAQRVAQLGSWEWDIAEDTVTWSDELYRIFGLKSGELDLTYAGVLERVHPEDRVALDQLVSRATQTLVPWVLRHRILRPDGEVRHVEGRGEVVSDRGGVAFTMHGTVRDRTSSVLLEQHFHEVSDALELVRLTANAVHEALDVNAALRSMLDVVCRIQRWSAGRVWRIDTARSSGLIATGIASGASAVHWPAPSLLASEVLEHWRPRARPAGDTSRATARNLPTGAVVLAAPLAVNDEILYVVEFEGDQPVADDHMVVAAIQSACATVAQRIEQELAESRVFEAQSHDPLTGLPTRPMFLAQAQRALAGQRRTGAATAIYSVALDHFHRVNDEHGLDAGDAVLVSVANRLRVSLREHDKMARGAITRVGGDEFLVLCEGVRDEAAALVIAKRVLDMVGLPIELETGQVAVTARIGISMSADNSEPQQMILDAEAAQRHAKELGGARHQFFVAEHHRRVAAESVLSDELQHAVTASEFRLVYQPKISLATNRIVGVEALLRWEHPERGMIPPGEFIPAAERSGVVVQVGVWVLKESLRQAAVWHNAYPRTPVQVAVNVSARQFRTGLARIISQAVAEAGVDASTVCLEMTETTVMDDIDSTVTTLEELKQLGFVVSIDDFGTGYSSLEYLHRMPIDEVKIDRSFIAGLGVDPVNTAIVATVINLAHAMDVEVVAEGVETPEQLERLRTLGCDFAQGYLIAAPMPPSEIYGYLAANAAGQQLPRAESLRDSDAAPVTETVLIVDDTADVRMLAKMSLTSAGYTVEEAGNGAAAIALARRIAPQCVLLDVSMPEMSGIDVCRALRDDPVTAGCTIVMLTTHADSADKAEAFLVGADDYIVKPFTPRDLVTRVRSALHRKQTTIGKQVDTRLLAMLQSARQREPADSLLGETESLSNRQLEILERLLQGERVPRIARELYLSQSTVRNHLSAIYKRLGVHSQEELLGLPRQTRGSSPPPH